MLGTILSTAANVVGGLLARKSTKDANKENIAQQREFAQNSIQWRAEDARKAGIHPAFAMGAPTMSFAPSSVGDSSMPAAMASMGQDLGRAFDVTRSGQQKMDARVQSLTLTRMQLENDLLSSQIAKINQVGSSPNFPGTPGIIDGQGDVPDLRMPGGAKYGRPLGSKTEDMIPYIGDEPAEWLHGGPTWLRMRFPTWYKYMGRKFTPSSYDGSDPAGGMPY